MQAFQRCETSGELKRAARRTRGSLCFAARFASLECLQAIYLPACLPTCPPACLPACPPSSTYLLAHLQVPTYLPACPPTSNYLLARPPACLPTCIVPACLPAYLSIPVPTYLPACPSTSIYLLACLPAFLPTRLPNLKTDRPGRHVLGKNITSSQNLPSFFQFLVPSLLQFTMEWHQDNEFSTFYIRPQMWHKHITAMYHGTSW